MLGFVFSHWSLLAPLVLAVAVLVLLAFFMPGGLALVLSRKVLLALALLAVATGAMLWWEKEKEDLRAEGAARAEAVAAQARQARLEENAGWALLITKRDSELRGELAGSLKTIETLQAELDRRPRVTQAANRMCTITLGFVRDYDASLPSSARRPSVQPAEALGDDTPAGVPLDRIAAEIRHNNGAAAACVEALAAAERRRFETCIEYDKRYGTSSGCTQ